MTVGAVTAFGEWAISYFEVSGSSVAGPHNAVLVGGAGAVGSMDEDDDPEAAGETAQDSEAYGAPGIVFRPRAPEQVDTDAGPVTLGCESYGVRRGDRSVPLAWRDLRFNRVFPSGPAAGSIALVGYGGGFLAFNDSATDSGDQKASVCVLYCPREFSGGTHAKAHSIILDPVENTVSMIHGDGLALVMDASNGITARADGSTYWTMKPGAFTMVANTINLRGNVSLGRDTTLALPMLPGPAFQGAPSVWVSPV